MPARRPAVPGSVALVGAGPGDPGLITVRGHVLLRGADVVVYDRLVSETLLASVRADAELIYAGKRPRAHTMTQAEINKLLVARARAGKTVVRLKGGDPFVFGRGGEEAEALARAGVAFEVVPGVTSAVAAPAVAGIPVTHRDIAGSVVIATARVAASPAGDTAVFLMSVERLEEVARALVASGRAPSTPVAVIQDATLPSQRTVVATLRTVAAAARKARIEPPAVVVVGDVVKLREQLGGWDTRPLSGVRVLVTRTREQASELSQILRELGADVVEAPAIRVEPPRSYASVDRAVVALASGLYSWVVFTSANGVRAFAARLAAAGCDARAFAHAKVCAVGPGTAEVLTQIGIVADLVPPKFTTAEIARAFPRGKGRVLLARADEVEPGLDDALERKGWSVDRVVVYRLRRASKLDPKVRRALLAGDVDVVTFASGGTVRAFASLLRAKLPAKTKVVCIGPVTAREARKAGLRVRAVADPHTIPALAVAVLRATGRA
jgi:uroporphyrinogen III methyltransferase/synthase